MRIDILTLFPEVFTPLEHSIPGRTQKAGLAAVHLHQIREWGVGKHRQVDDTPYGGGPGMVMSCPPLYAAFEHLQGLDETPMHIIYLSPQGPRLEQSTVMRLSQEKRLVLLCGHYEGIDERVIEEWVDEEVSVGDYVVSGGELPAMLLCDAILRVLPGAIDAGSVEQDSFYAGQLDHPHYTRPADYRERKVPDVLLSGDHAKIERWRAQQRQQRTAERRPDLLN
jgi:tRNA (guanine37-N1)-methyltransferase